ncbi:MAG: histidinol dehydrogenase [Aigarchaeota archaeon]|nr:histidinol dehydrogenase [Aigarchaeota archaeon]MDW8092209.1 histidinol dehydrogenase [Nitrososphaerota archaeon]
MSRKVSSLFQVVRLEELDGERRSAIIDRGRTFSEDLLKRVREIVEDVRRRGDDSIAEFLSEQLGRRVRADEILVKREMIGKAYKRLDRRVVSAIRHMVRNVMKFHRLQMPKPFFVEIERGVRAGQLVIPLDSAGLYVPAGKAAYPSVAVMVAVPAKVAGVDRIVLASPPWDGEMAIEPATLVAGQMSGATEFYVMGGAHAVAALAYGTQRIRRVDCIAGPGGPFTYLAKELVRDVVRTDIPAGPSESLVLTDGTLPLEVVCWDFLNEAEHGPDSTAVLVCTSEDFALRVAEKLEEMVESLTPPRKEYLIQQRERSAIVVCRDLESAIRFVNEFAPEHLVIDSRHASRIFRRYRRVLRNFGTLCMNTPSVAGSYGIGPNSTLPTGGYARFYSGLSVDNFLKRPTVEELRGVRGYRALYETVLTLAEHEGFPSHAEAYRSRANFVGLGVRARGRSRVSKKS